MYHITLLSLDESARSVARLVFDDIPFQHEMQRANTLIQIVTGQYLPQVLERNRFDAIITPGNSYGFMTGGFDLALVQYFDVQHPHFHGIEHMVRRRIVQSYCGELLVGQALVVGPNPTLPSAIVYAPTMRVPMHLPTYSQAPYQATLAAFQAIHQANQMSYRNRIYRVLLPVMGMGTGGLPVELVARQMQMALIQAVAGHAIADLPDHELFGVLTEYNQRLIRPF